MLGTKLSICFFSVVSNFSLNESSGMFSLRLRKITLTSKINLPTNQKLLFCLYRPFQKYMHNLNDYNVTDYKGPDHLY